jgi:hypothetical protein
VTQLKAYGIWTKLKAVYPFVGGSASSNIVSFTYPNSATIWFNNYQPGDPNDDYPYGYANATIACSQGGNSGQFATVYYTGTLGNGTVLYNDVNRTQNFNYAGSIFWYWINGSRFTYTFGVIADYDACPSNAVDGLSANAFDILGEIYVGAVVSVTNNVTSDTLFTVRVSTSLGDVDVYVIITSGNKSGNAETYTGMGSTPGIEGACISGCDDEDIVLTGYTC